MMMIPVKRIKNKKIIKLFYREWQAMSFLDVEVLLKDEIFFFVIFNTLAVLTV